MVEYTSNVNTTRQPSQTLYSVYKRRMSSVIDFISLISSILDSTFPAMDNSEIQRQFAQSALSPFLLKIGIMSVSFSSFGITSVSHMQ